MFRMNQALATCCSVLLLAAFLCEPVLCKGGRGGSRGSSRGTHARSPSTGRGGAYGGTRSRYRAAGRSSAVRVASAAAAGAAVAVALSADKWYASAYRRSNADIPDDDAEYYNRTVYFDALMSSSTQNISSLYYHFLALFSIIIATFSPQIWTLTGQSTVG